jgi:hypothetical protein
MRANAEALFQDMLGKNFGGAFKNTHNLRGRKKTPPPKIPDDHGP